MIYSEAIQYLYDLQLFGSKLGLENPRRLAALAGNPQDKLCFIHVAGTNGKGSTCAMLESIYRASGLRVGLFTSPHLVAFGERIQVNRQLISEPEVARLTEEMRQLLKYFPAEAHPTFFEVVTVMALRYFAEQKVDLVIWETGLGGRLDATNIVTPLASVITNIQFDHEQWLGNSIEQIAAEKAGIIKPHVPVITAADDAQALTVLREIAAQKSAPFHFVTKANVEEFRPLLSRLPLPGEHQCVNAALAVATVQILSAQIPASSGEISTGLSGVNWPGRLQMVQPAPGRKILLDGAHNLASVEVLLAALPSLAGGQPVTLILGIMRDKDWRPMCQLLARNARRILVVPVNSKRTAATAELASACREENPRAEVLECSSLRAALACARQDPFTVVTGSLYLIGEAMEVLGLSSATSADERVLNEWSASNHHPHPAHATR